MNADELRCKLIDEDAELKAAYKKTLLAQLEFDETLVRANEKEVRMKQLETTTTTATLPEERF